MNGIDFSAIAQTKISSSKIIKFIDNFNKTCLLREKRCGAREKTRAKISLHILVMRSISVKPSPVIIVLKEFPLCYSHI